MSNESTGAYDRGEKLEHYRQIPTLREYVIVSHRERRIDVRRREDDGTWRADHSGRGEIVTLPSIGVDLGVDKIYDRSPLTRSL